MTFGGRHTLAQSFSIALAAALLGVSCRPSERVLFSAQSEDGKYRAEVVTWRSWAATYEAELRLFVENPPGEIGRLAILGGRDEPEDITNEIRGIRWSNNVLQLVTVRSHLLFPEGIMVVTPDGH